MIIIDVGAYNGTPYLSQARKNPNLVVYAFEPNHQMVNTIRRTAPTNYHIYPMVISETNGIVEMHQNICPQTNSILPFDNGKVKLWAQGSKLKSINTLNVESIRLDTFMEREKINEVDFLKIDAQGADLQVLRSCGDKLFMVKKVQVEICDIQIYQGGNMLNETVEYLNNYGFKPIKTVQNLQYKDMVLKNENY